MLILWQFWQPELFKATFNHVKHAFGSCHLKLQNKKES